MSATLPRPAAPRLDGRAAAPAVVLDRNAFEANSPRCRGGGLSLAGTGSRVALDADLVDKRGQTEVGGGVWR